MIGNLYYEAIITCKKVIKHNYWLDNDLDLATRSPEQFWQNYCKIIKNSGQNSIILRAAMKAILMAASIYEDGWNFDFYMPSTSMACSFYKQARKSLKKPFRTYTEEDLYSDGSPSGEYRICIF